MKKPMDVNATHNVPNTYVVIIMNRKTGDVAAQRITGVDTATQTPKPWATERERLEAEKGFRAMAQTYARSLGWRPEDTRVELLGPLTPAISRMVYDAIPGDRISVAEADKLFAAMTSLPGFSDVVNLRRATDDNRRN